jgi:hypothetical protein
MLILNLILEGLYPPLARFVSSIQEPVGFLSCLFAGWQEASRKDVVRGFGVFQRKFHILVKDFELWFIEDIMEIVECCIILHNMMVSVQVAHNEEENSSWYKCNDDEEDDTDTAPFHDPDLEYVEQCEAELALHH